MQESKMLRRSGHLILTVLHLMTRSGGEHGPQVDSHAGKNGGLIFVLLRQKASSLMVYHFDKSSALKQSSAFQILWPRFDPETWSPCFGAYKEERLPKKKYTPTHSD